MKLEIVETKYPRKANEETPREREIRICQAPAFEPMNQWASLDWNGVEEC